MTITYATAVKNARLDAVTTAIGTTGVLEIGTTGIYTLRVTFVDSDGNIRGLTPDPEYLIFYE